jgi:hypothetical protein
LVVLLWMAATMVVKELRAWTVVTMVYAAPMHRRAAMCSMVATRTDVWLRVTVQRGWLGEGR